MNETTFYHLLSYCFVTLCTDLGRCGGPNGGACGEERTAHAAALLVLLQVTPEREPLTAARARERAVGRVDLHVRPHVALVRERLAAHAALEGPLARVHTHVACVHDAFDIVQLVIICILYF